ARATITGPGQASACIGWGRQPDDGAGLFYEAAGESLEAAERRVEDGLEHGRSLRGWEFGQHLLEGITIEGRDGEHATAVAVATYGEAHDIIR
ncbi:MAG: pyruvoyl-dependent arginine decarboxylase, partial [Halobacteriaceae archaeon]